MQAVWFRSQVPPGAATQIASAVPAGAWCWFFGRYLWQLLLRFAPTRSSSVVLLVEQDASQLGSPAGSKTKKSDGGDQRVGHREPPGLACNRRRIVQAYRVDVRSLVDLRPAR